jgi:SSS family solute:Na+ symporter
VGTAADGLRLQVSGLDYLLLALCFVTVLGIGFVARMTVRTSTDFFLSGRSLPAWITDLAFLSANLGATEILGMAANGAQYGAMTLHYYWIGAVPAMVFLGIVMMPFYWTSLAMLVFGAVFLLWAYLRPVRRAEDEP